jgi:hypothetical protein
MSEHKTDPGCGPNPDPSVALQDQINAGVRLAERLRNTPNLTSEVLRGHLTPLFGASLAVLEGVAQKLGLSASGGKDELTNRIEQHIASQSSPPSDPQS